MAQEIPQPSALGQTGRRRSIWTWVGVSVLVAAVVLLAAGEVMLRRAGPDLKAKVIETLTSHFNSRVELENFNVSLIHGFEASGDRLRIYAPGAVVAAGAEQPLIAVEHFSFHTGLTGIFRQPVHVGTAQVSGLHINIPSREMRQKAPEHQAMGSGKIPVVIDTIVCDKSQLIVGTSKPGKDPLDFELSRIQMDNVGPNDPWRYNAVLVNAIPRGDIHAVGTFGPWKTEDPGESLVTGHYTFDHADLNTIKGIAGILSSVGDFKGQLNRIEVEGTTDTPDFSLDTANHPLPLHTQFHAIVDGTSGDTYLEPVKAKLRNSAFSVSGSVIDVKGKGHTIDLDVDVSAGQMRDFLDLAVKTQPAIMTGLINTKAKLHIPPGRESVSQKLDLKGMFSVGDIHFTNAQVQEKVDMFSLRAQGDPQDAKPGAREITSQMKGQFSLQQGVLQFGSLLYSLPGANVNLDGTYSLDGRIFDFEGNVRTEATLSQMVASRWKSLVLKTVSPFFKKNGAGAEIPIRITGTESEPKFGLDVHLKGKPDDRPPAGNRNP